MSLRVPPNNVDFERAFLGGVLFNSSSIDEHFDYLSKEDFYHVPHQVIFNTLDEMRKSGNAIDVMSLHEHLKIKGLLERVGGLAYLGKLNEAIPSDLAFYAKVIKEKGIRRKMIEVASKISTYAFKEDENLDDSLKKAEEDFFSIEEGQRTEDIVHLDKVAKSAFEHVNEMVNSRERLVGISSGFSGLDDLTRGFRPGQLIILAARPGMGKTALALNFARNAAEFFKTQKSKFEERSVLVYSLEMTKEELGTRLLCMQSKIGLDKFTPDAFKPADYSKRLTDAVYQLSQLDIYVNETSGLNLEKLKSYARKLDRDKKIGMVVIDYLQLVTTDVREGREKEIGKISRDLKALAKDLRAPVIALSQLNRSLENREDKRPRLSDLRESGSIEQDADIIGFIHREAYHDENAEDKMKTELLIKKHRNGALANIDLAFDAPKMLFTQYEYHRAEPFQGGRPVPENSFNDDMMSGPPDYDDDAPF